MKKEHIPYFDGRDLDKVVARLMNDEDYRKRVEAMKKAEGKPVVATRYPHPFEAQN